eukprot:CAMPEP_0202701092 /NCGR_PEP_ID=MMETSP1385-20130828/14195_1 /ASSEMBLY_ACC=CAM_ASM_000861 /TAXON_ID=933848 /ORGANISM="Elphidium margaritaceum" /LENGTH=384 /DNA_ID=CAMNT_0049358421 /DNA_START=16 /DNA_END=1167 /DNA_ORIENTATION=-
MTDSSLSSDQSQSDNDQCRFCVQSLHARIPPPIHARPTVQRSQYTGLFFPTGRVWHAMRDKIVNRGKNNIRVIRPDAAVCLTAVLEYLTGELLQSSGNAARRMHKSRIEPMHILSLLRMNDEFGMLLATKESGTRASVPASPFDLTAESKPPARPATTNVLSFWPEDHESDTECTDHEIVSQRKETRSRSRSRSHSVDDVLELLPPADDIHALCKSYTLNNDDQFISGLFYVENYVTQQQHDSMVRIVNNNEWQKVETRVVQHYGYRGVCVDDEHASVSKIHRAPFHEIPSEMQCVVQRVLRDDLFGIPSDCDMQQLTVDNFPSFGGLHARLENIHCFDEYIICVSLLSEVVMHFTHIESKQTKQLLLRPRSVLVLSGDARYKW